MGSGPPSQELLGCASILVIAYHICHGVDFNDLGADYLGRMNTAKLKRYHLRRLAKLGSDALARHKAG